jgi:hypothetical protein
MSHTVYAFNFTNTDMGKNQNLEGKEIKRRVGRNSSVVHDFLQEMG